MIEYLSGKLIHKEPTHILVDVNNVGYGLDIPLNTYHSLPYEGENVNLFVHTYLREDVIKLFGFSTKEERDIFRVLLGISGVGPKLALGILSTYKPSEFASAIEREDYSLLTKIPGIGKKTAERLIVDLREKMLQFATAQIKEEMGVSVMSEKIEDAIGALVSLGCSRVVAIRAIKKAVEILGEDASLEDLIKEGLKHR